jgi:hypothetical protein
MGLPNGAQMDQQGYDDEDEALPGGGGIGAAADDWIELPGNRAPLLTGPPDHARISFADAVAEIGQRLHCGLMRATKFLLKAGCSGKIGAWHSDGREFTDKDWQCLEYDARKHEEQVRRGMLLSCMKLGSEILHPRAIKIDHTDLMDLIERLHCSAEMPAAAENKSEDDRLKRGRGGKPPVATHALTGWYIKRRDAWPASQQTPSLNRDWQEAIAKFPDRDVTRAAVAAVREDKAPDAWKTGGRRKLSK